MQKYLRIGVVAIIALLVLEALRVAVSAMDRIEIRVVKVDKAPVIEVLDQAFGTTPQGLPGAATAGRFSGGISQAGAPQAAATPTATYMAVPATETAQPLATERIRPTLTPTTTPTLVPYITVIPDEKTGRKTDAPATSVPGPAQPTDTGPLPTPAPPEDSPALPTSAPVEAPTSAPAALPTSAP